MSMIILCDYCGEPTKQKYCSNCKTQAGRKDIFEQNVAIFKQNEKLGYKVPKELKNYK
jgi:predicted amidophosphoribosyltransferase